MSITNTGSAPDLLKSMLASSRDFAQIETENNKEAEEEIADPDRVLLSVFR